MIQIENVYQLETEWLVLRLLRDIEMSGLVPKSTLPSLSECYLCWNGNSCKCFIWASLGMLSADWPAVKAQFGGISIKNVQEWKMNSLICTESCCFTSTALLIMAHTAFIVVQRLTTLSETCFLIHMAFLKVSFFPSLKHTPTPCLFALSVPGETGLTFETQVLQRGRDRGGLLFFFLQHATKPINQPPLCFYKVPFDIRSQSVKAGYVIVCLFLLK